jgi:xanthine dehydrogenase large subunit
MMCDTGFSANEATSLFALIHMQSAYKAIGWEVKPGFVTTNTPANIACRAPGSPQVGAFMENLMEHIAHYLKKDSLDIRKINFLERGDEMLQTLAGGGIFDQENQLPRMIEEIKQSGNYEERKKFLETFNKVYKICIF